MKKTLRVILNIFIFIFALACIFGIVYSLYNIFNWKKDVDSNKKLKQEIYKKIEKKSKDDYDIDFASLKAENPDTVAFLKVKGTDIEYVVVKGADNDYYLKKDFNKNYNSAGWIFADYRNKFDGTDKNLIIYGHNMIDGSMFGTLKNILKPEWYENPENREILLITEQGKFKYQTFSVYSIEAEDYYINTEFKDEEEHFFFLNEIKYRSDFDFGVELTKDDQVLTLSSCIGYGESRVVLHAKLIK